MDKNQNKKLEIFKEKYLSRLLELYKPSNVIVFGSRARGDFLKESDLDLIVVSDKFSSIRFIDRAYRVLMDIDIDMGVDILCYTPKEFEEKKKELGIVQVAVEEGIELVPSKANI